MAGAKRTQKTLLTPTGTEPQSQPLCLLLPPQLTRPRATILLQSLDTARFGIRGHFNQEVSRVNGMKKKDTALNCLVSARLPAMVYGSGEAVWPAQMR